MSDYDISIMKNNIKAIMEEKSITQTQLAEAIGISQPQISATLNSRNSNSFTITQLVDIARFLGCTTDKILGSNQNEKKKEIESLSDILNIIFELDSDSASRINIGTCKTGAKEHLYDDIYGEVETTGFYFTIPEMKIILDEWRSIKNTNIENKSLKERMLNLWKEETIKKYSNNRKEWGFRNELEWGRCLAKLCLFEAGYECSLDDDLIGEDCGHEENFPILKKYVENLMNQDDYFSEKECIAIKDILYDDTPEDQLPFD